MLKKLLSSLTAKEIEKEVYGTLEDYEAQQLKDVGKPKKIKNKIKVEVDGVEYDSINQATQDLGVDVYGHYKRRVKGITNRLNIKFK